MNATTGIALVAALKAITTGLVPVTDQIRIAAHDLFGQIGITLMMSLGGIAFDDQILSFDITQAAQLSEKRAPCAPPTGFGKKGNRDCRMKNRYPGLRRSLLRPRRPRRGGKQQTGREFPPSHCTYASERLSNIVSGYDRVAHRNSGNRPQPLIRTDVRVTSTSSF
jgi:hypothetical protein